MNTTESEQKLTRKEAENIALCMWDMLKMQSIMGGKVDVDWYKGILDELLNEHFANHADQQRLSGHNAPAHNGRCNYKLITRRK